MEQEPILDQIDLAILRELQRDSRLSVRELARRVHRSPTPVFERLRRLEAEGVIQAYTIQIDHEKAGGDFMVFCNVKLRQINTAIHEEFAASILEMPEVAECYNVSGTIDYILKVHVRDMGSYRRFVTDSLGRLESVDSVQSVFVMSIVKRVPEPI